MLSACWSMMEGMAARMCAAARTHARSSCRLCRSASGGRAARACPRSCTFICIYIHIYTRPHARAPAGTLGVSYSHTHMPAGA